MANAKSQPKAKLKPKPGRAKSRKVTPFLWFDGNAEDAARFYVSVFPNSRITDVARMGPGKDAPVLTVSFELDGTEVTALNGGPHFKLNEAFSFYLDCEDQAEVDRLWKKLTADGGEESMCGWLKDKFGLSWQIIPSRLVELMTDEDPKKAKRVMDAMLKMRKIDVKKLEAAHAAR